MRERGFPAVLEAVVNEVLSLEGVRDTVLARVRELHEQGGSVAAELRKLDKDEKRLVSAIVQSRQREVEEQASRKQKLPSAAKLLEHLEAVAGQLLGDENRAAVILRQLLDGPIRVVPFMRIDGTRVVPRLEFAINLMAALPPAVAAPLHQAAGDDVEDERVAILNRTLMVNAFDEPQLVKHTRVIVERRLEGKTYKEIAKELDRTDSNMENCAAITRLKIAAAHITEI